MNLVPVVDLFSGPGGLAEGFAALRGSEDGPRFEISLSIEMDDAAYRTLRLRAFLREFSSGFPPEYYDFLNDLESKEPDWESLYPDEWKKACYETLCLKLGTSDSVPLVQRRIDLIRELHGNRTVLLGGPPCQSYSIVGRSRNSGNSHYNADEDERHSLYKEYANVLERLQPVVAVMENVGGILSARHNNKFVFPDVMKSLQHAGGQDRYQLHALASPCENRTGVDRLNWKDFLVYTENYGIPQNRHRVFVICIRSDVAESLPIEMLPKLVPADKTLSMSDVIGLMPVLRSRLSRADDEISWQNVVKNACAEIRTYLPMVERQYRKRFSRVLDDVMRSLQMPVPPFRYAEGGIDISDSCPTKLRDWIVDRNITVLPNNETKAHMQEDITRYLFATIFAIASKRSPKTSDFPLQLAPNHSNWNTGKFSDRFRVQLRDRPSTTITSHLSKDGHYFIHPDPKQCRSLTVREVARLQTFPDNYFFHGNRTQQYVQVGNAVPPFLALQIAEQIQYVLEHFDSIGNNVMHQRCNRVASHKESGFSNQPS